MIEFVTLFLGLTVGLQNVEITTSGPVERVELVLDGAALMTLDQPPWRSSIDFGLDLSPHELTAIAFGPEGELARTSQWINLPRSSAEARMVLDTDDAGRVRAVRLSWESSDGGAPTRVDVALDGQPLAVGDPSVIELPGHDPRQPHFVTAELQFADGSFAHAESSFGGEHGTEVVTELTAVPLRWAQSGDWPESSEDVDWLEYRGQRLEVVAVDDDGPAEVVVVRDSGVELMLRDLRQVGGRRPSGRRFGPKLVRDPTMRRFDMQMSLDYRVRFLWPSVNQVEHPRFELGLFDTSVVLTAEDGGFFWFLTRLYPREPGRRQQLADAVAVAGRRAAAGYRRRAVVLVLGPKAVEHSNYNVQQVRSYLRDLRVPLVVWTSQKAKPSNGITTWGESRRVDSLARLSQAVRQLEKVLAGQRILWVAGHYLPQEIRLSSAAPEGLELVQ